MFHSLRFRLPAIFLIGIAISGVIASLIALQLFQEHVRDQVVAELEREARGLARLYAEHAGDIPLSRQSLEAATGDYIYGVEVNPGVGLWPGADTDLRPLPADAIPSATLEEPGLITFEFVPPGEDRPFLAVAHPLRLGEQTFGAIVVAKPATELRERSMVLFQRLALAFLAGILVAGALAWYLSRRITEPVLALSRAADEVAAGRYDVDVPQPKSRDEIGHLAERFSEMAARLHETEQLERKFLMSVSHELRTPLTAIRGHVEALREGVVEDPDVRADSLDVIAAEAGRLERLVGDVLDLAKLDAHRFTVLEEEVDMRRLLERAYGAFEQEARRRAIDYELQAEAAPVIVSDGDRVLQIISNLLTNAFKWTPDGGRIDLELQARNGTVSVAVQDTGPGIPRRERARVFRPFFSGDGRGTGLGLAIAHELAVALGGRIDLESTPGEGSRFELVLPAREGLQAPEPALGGRRSSMR
ncbi:MAG TPA: HAMP domain-containing sensor histidine kinase [Gaiellaceae bacterium]|nr:HAMP domain-containing sensor histidine kinase [Gaiellaceae bacterium]